MVMEREVPLYGASLAATGPKRAWASLMDFPMMASAWL